MKNENGIEKSAILKGQTLVNLCKSNQTFTINNTISNQTISTSKTYTLIIDKTQTNQLNINFHYTDGTIANDYKAIDNGIIGEKKMLINFSRVDTSKTVDNICVYYAESFTGTATTLTEKLMLIEGDYTNINIPYFEGMQSVQMPSLMTTGKNLWNNKIFENCPIATINNDGSLTLNGTLNQHWIFKYTIDKGTYSSSAIGNDNGYIHMFWGGGDGYFQTNKPFNIAEQITRDGYIAKGTYDNINIKLQLEQGSTTTPYEPHKSNILTVNEPVELRGIGNVQDELDLLTGELTERIGEIVLDGSEEWIKDMLKDDDTFLNIVFKTKIDNIIDYNNLNTGMLSDKFKQVIGDKLWSEDISGIGGAYGFIKIGVPKSYLASADLDGFKQWLSQNHVTVQYQLKTPTIKIVDLIIQDQDNQPQERMRLFPNGYINTSSSTFPPILELKGITHNNKLNMTTTNGTNNTQLTTLDNLAFDGIICRDGTVVRDSYDVESGLYTIRVFRFTVDEEFIERYRSGFVNNGGSTTCFEFYINVVNNCNFPQTSGDIGIASNISWDAGGEKNRIITATNLVYIRLLKEEVSSYDVNGILDWIKRNGAIEVAYQLATPQIIHMQPNMQPYVSTRPYQGSIESQGNILESSFLDYTSEQSIISPKPLGDGDVLRWEQGSQCYVYENDKEYIPLTDYNQPMGTVLDLEEEDGEQFVENLDGGDIIVDVPFKEKAVYERHLVSHEDNIIYPTQDKLDPTGKIEVDYICGETWQNPNDLSDIRHVGTLRADGQYDVTIRRSGDDEIRLLEGTTHLSLDGDGLNPSEFELTFFNNGGVEVGKYGDTIHTLEDCVKDSKLETGTVYGQTLVNLINFKANSYQAAGSVTSRGINTITFTTNSTGKFNIVCTVDLKPSAKYCIKANIQSTNNVTFRVLDVKANQYKINETILANGEYIGTF